jgi:4-diphosphocytidyl-2-C-methyl-D-erythritol kinase
VSGVAARVLAQAKINLFLRVGSRDAAGYHDIDTLFARLDLADDVVVRAYDDGPRRAIDCRGADTGEPTRNLGFRAAEAFAAAAGWPRGFAIEIDKRIPIGGGLGGGSADAGAVLRALNALAPAPLPREHLLRIAATLGADVSFVTTEFAMAFGSGRGDQLRPGPELAPREMMLIVFPVAVPTADAYAWLDAARGDVARPWPPMPEAASVMSWDAIDMRATNDFEHVVGTRFPVIASALEAARMHGAHIAQMSGSGSSVFIGPPHAAATLSATSAVRHRRIMAGASVVAVERLE